MPEADSVAQLTVRIAPGPGGAGAVARSGARVRAVVNPKPFGVLRVYAPSVDGLRDVVVLRDTAAPSKADALYWAQLDVSAATPAEGGSDYLVLRFDEDLNEGGRKGEAVDLDALTYSLEHWPLGTGQAKRYLFEGRSGPDTFSSGRPPAPATQLEEVTVVATRLPPSPADAEAPPIGSDVSDYRPHMTSLVAVEVRLSDQVRFPPAAFERVGLLRGTDSSTAVELQRPAALSKDTADPLAEAGLAAPIVDGEDDARGLPDASFTGRPVPVAVREGAWPNGTPKPTTAPADEETSTTAPPPDETPSEPEERWVYVFRVQENAEYRRVLESSERLRQPVREHYPNPTSLVGVWRLAGDGTCQLTTYPEGDGADDFPEPVGPTGSFFFLGTGLVTTHPDRTAYAHVSDVALPRARLARLEAPLRVLGLPHGHSRGVEPPGETSLAPLDLVARPDERTFFERLHACYDTTARAWTWYLPDPLRVTVRLAGLVRENLDRYDDWATASSAAVTHSGLIGATCYSKAHGRDHLLPFLEGTLPGPGGLFGGSTPDGYHPLPAGAFGKRSDVASAWAGFTPGGVGVTSRPPGADHDGKRDSALRHFQYGVYCQRGYLRHRVQVAGNRLAAWVASPTFEAYVRDLGIDLLQDDLREEARNAVVRAVSISAEAGGGAGILLRWLQEAGVIDRLPQGPSDATGRGTLEDVLDRPVPITSVTDVLDAPLFDTLWLFTEKGLETAAVMLDAAGSTITLARRLEIVGAYSGRVLGALFACRALGARPAVGDGGAAIGPLRFEAWGRDLDGRPFVPHRVPGGATSRDLRAPMREWRVSVTTDAAGGAVGGFVGGLDVAITAAGVYRNVQANDVGWGDAVAAGQVVTESVGVADALVQAERVRVIGEAFAKGAVWLEALGAAVEVHGAYMNEVDHGVQRVRRTEWVGVAGSVVKGAGAILIAKGAAGGLGAITSSPVAAVGLACVAVGWGLAWVGEQVQASWKRADDPLSLWLPDDDVWGRSYPGGDRETLNALVRPEWAGGREVVLKSTFLGGGAERGMTGTFIQTAYTFPVTVVPRKNLAGAVVGLTFQISPLFVPAGGTLTLSATVSRTGFDSVPVRCAVHYVRDGKRLLYGVVGTEGKDADGVVRAQAISVPADGDLLALADREGWTPSVRAEVTVRKPSDDGKGETRTETHDVIEVHVGPRRSLATTSEDAGERPLDLPGQDSARPQDVLSETLSEALQSPYSPPVPDGDMYTPGAFLDATRGAERGFGLVPRMSVVPGVDAGQLRSAVGGGAVGAPFAVSGAAFFRPAPPFDPAPVVPGPQADPTDASVEVIGPTRAGLRYPDDFPEDPK